MGRRGCELSASQGAIKPQGDSSPEGWLITGVKLGVTYMYIHLRWCLRSARRVAVRGKPYPPLCTLVTFHPFTEVGQQQFVYQWVGITKLNVAVADGSKIYHDGGMGAVYYMRVVS